MLRQLRPVFYSVENQPEVLSGWINPKTRDVFTTKIGNLTAIELVPRARPAFQTGERVEFTNRIELYPAEDILPHERGNVASWDIETGAVSIFLEGVHDGLEDNTLVIAPFHDDWIVGALQRYRNGAEPLPVEEAPHEPGIGWALIALLVAAPLALLVDNTIGHAMAPTMFCLAVFTVALVFGRSQAVVLALIAPVVSNYIVGPELGFDWPTGFEVWRACIWMLIALTAPWLRDHASEIRERAEAISQLLRSHKAT